LLPAGSSGRAVEINYVLDRSNTGILVSNRGMNVCPSFFCCAVLCR